MRKRTKLMLVGVLVSLCGAATAQSSVTVFGILDLGVRAVKNGDGSTVTSLTSGGLSTSRFGVRGSEDMGGGLKAGFWLEGAMNPDVGTNGSTASATASTGASTNAKFFDRRATMSLSGAFGEVRLGRDYTPTFTNLSVFDVYGSTGFAGEANLLGGGSPVAVGTLGSGGGTLARADNSVGYFLRDINGFSANAMVAASEGVNNTNGNNRYVGGRLGWRGGPVDTAVAYGRTRIPGNGDLRVWNAGGRYDFAVVKLTALFHRADYAPSGLASRSQKLLVLGGYVPFGGGEFRGTWQRSNMSGGNVVGLRDQDDARQFAVGYIYHLSKRTALYSDAARIQNRGRSALTIAGGSTVGSNLGVLNDKNSTAFVLGMRHNF